MLAQYAVEYLQKKIQELEPQQSSALPTRRSSIPDEQYFDNFVILDNISEQTSHLLFDSREQKHLGYLKEAVKRLKTLPSDAKLSDILPILHGHRKTTEDLSSSKYYNGFIKPLETQLIEQERLLVVEKERQANVEKKSDLPAKQQVLGEVDQESLVQVEAFSPTKAAKETLPQVEQEPPAQVVQDHVAQIKKDDGNDHAPKINPEKSIDYYYELVKLRQKLNPEVSSKLDTLLVNTAKLHENDSIIKTRIFETTYHLLTEAMPVEEYRDFARTVQGKPSTLLKCIGSIMLSIAALFVALALTFSTEGLSLSVVVSSASMAGPGMFSLFAGRQSGISKDMEDLTNTYTAKL